MYWIADPQALKIVTSDRLVFVKDFASVRFITINSRNQPLTENF